MEEQRISFDPTPPVRGQSVTICYDFDGAGITSTTLRVTFDPGGQSSDHDVSDQNHCVTITVPSDAKSILVEDLSGVSPNNTSPCVKPAAVPA
ncbi:MAG: hypothetical protein ACE37K_25180 [Planctomycetota bacterium]